MGLVAAVLNGLRALAVLVLLCPLAPAHADAEGDGATNERKIDVASLLRGRSLGPYLDTLQDASGKLHIEQVRGAAEAARFKPSEVAAPSFGFTSSAYWLRFTVVNTSNTARPWLLELGYPMLDYVTLFEPRADGGFDLRSTGDMLPFSQRDIASRNFVFALEEPPGRERTYFLRVRTTGSMSLPLVAWSTHEFLEHQHLDWSALCIFYGVLLVMAWYNGCVWILTRQREYLPYVGYIVSLALVQFTIAGHTFQFLLPRDPTLVHRLLPASMFATLAFGTMVVVQTYLRPGHFLYRARNLIVAAAALGIVASFVISFSQAIRMANGLVLSVLLCALVTGVELLRMEGRRAKLFLLGWGGMVGGALVATLQTLGLLPHSFFTDWSVQIGASVQLVLVSSALADKLNTAQKDLDGVHETLRHKVGQLSLALQRAEEATQRAERATRQKDEFMATMSHEFRTPLNPIINIPQEMRAEFRRVRRASCTQCASVFELDEGEHVDAHTTCPDCAHGGTLREVGVLRYDGDAMRARRFLLKVGSSGRHLLSVVNGILEFSKLEAGHRELAREAVSVAELFADVAAPLRERAAQRGQRIECDLAGGDAVLQLDGQRIRQVLSNLLDNAIKYSERPGIVTLRGSFSGRGYTLSVSDEGIGIERRHFEQIFQSFEQVHKGTTRKYGGTGLGLSIARSIVRMHGGELSVESELGKGTTFSFELPGKTTVPIPGIERYAEGA
jgi:signal transduction histidine kinase